MIRVSAVQCDLSLFGLLQYRNGEPQLYDRSPGKDACTGKSEPTSASTMTAMPPAPSRINCRLRLMSESTVTTVEHSERAPAARSRDDPLRPARPLRRP